MLELYQHIAGKIEQTSTTKGKAYIDQDGSSGFLSSPLPFLEGESGCCRPCAEDAIDKDDVIAIVKEELEDLQIGGCCTNIERITNIDIDKL